MCFCFFEKPSLLGQGKAHYVIFAKVEVGKDICEGAYIRLRMYFCFGARRRPSDGHAYQGLMPKACELQKKSKYGAFYEYNI